MFFQRFFYKTFTSTCKFKQIFIKRCLQIYDLQKEITSLQTLIRQKSTFIYPQYRGSKFSKLRDLLLLQRYFFCSSHNSYFLLLGSVHIPAVLCYALVSTASSILNVYVASCFFITIAYLHIVCLHDPIELNEHNFIIATIVISNIKIVIFLL